MEKHVCTVIMDIGSIMRRANCVHKTSEGTATETDYYKPQENIVYVSESGFSCQQTNAMGEEEVRFFIPFIGLTLEEARRVVDENGIEVAFDETQPDDISIVLPKSNRSVSCKALLLFVYDSMINEICQKCDIVNVIVSIPAMYNQRQSEVFAQTLSNHSVYYVHPLQRELYYVNYIQSSYEVDPPAVMVDISELHCNIVSYEENSLEVVPVENMSMMVLSNLIYSQLCRRYSLHQIPKNFALTAIIKCLPELLRKNFVELDIEPYSIVIGATSDSKIRVEMSFFDNSVTDFFGRVFSLYSQLNKVSYTASVGCGYTRIIPDVENQCVEKYGVFWSAEKPEDCILEGLAFYYDEHGEEIPTIMQNPTQLAEDTTNEVCEDPSTLPPPSSMNVAINSMTRSFVDAGIVVEKPVPAEDVILPPPTPDAPVMRDDEPIYPILEEKQPAPSYTTPVVNEVGPTGVVTSDVYETPVSNVVQDGHVPQPEPTSDLSSAPPSVVSDLHKSTNSLLDSIVDLPPVYSGDSYPIVEPETTPLVEGSAISYPTVEPENGSYGVGSAIPDPVVGSAIPSYPSLEPIDPSFPVVDNPDPGFLQIEPGYIPGMISQPEPYDGDIPTPPSYEPEPEPQQPIPKPESQQPEPQQPKPQSEPQQSEPQRESLQPFPQPFPQPEPQQPEPQPEPQQPEPQPISQPEPQSQPHKETPISDTWSTASSQLPRVSIAVSTHSASTYSSSTVDHDDSGFVKESIYFGNGVLLLEKGTPLPTTVTRRYVPTKMEMRLNLKVYTETGDVIGHCDAVIKNGIMRNKPLDIQFEVESNKTIYYSSANKVSRRMIHCHVFFNKQTTIQTNN